VTGVEADVEGVGTDARVHNRQLLERLAAKIPKMSRVANSTAIDGLTQPESPRCGRQRAHRAANAHASRRAALHPQAEVTR